MKKLRWTLYGWCGLAMVVIAVSVAWLAGYRRYPVSGNKEQRAWALHPKDAMALRLGRLYALLPEPLFKLYDKGWNIYVDAYYEKQDADGAARDRARV